MDEFVVVAELFEETLNELSNAFGGRKGGQLSGRLLNGSDGNAQDVSNNLTGFEVILGCEVSLQYLEVSKDGLMVDHDVLADLGRQQKA